VAGKEELIREVAKAEDLLSRLEAEQEHARARLAALRAELAAQGQTEPAIQVHLPATPPQPVPRSPEEKVRLFRQFFRGRADVFPTRFVSKKTGKPGYAPACTNKFVRGVCELPKVKCGECPNQAFVHMNDAAILAHLQGRHVMGVYPLLEDETCWFLAVDFDKSTWQDDVLAFVATCRHVGLPAAVERSRSGNGAHVWFFFNEAVPAVIARRMGCHLITKTMSRRHELSMDSYDRLFPSQDTMPRGGFGNLIALPLQHGPRQQGNTLFLDDQLQPLPGDEQWAYLAAVPRIDRTAVERIAGEASRQGSVIGVRRVEPADEEEAEPWARAPSGRPRWLRVTEPLPERVRAVLSQRLFVEKTGLPSPILNQIKRLAAFQNPEFYKKQSMRLSTALTPRVISCAEELAQHVALPRGCRSDLEALLGEHGVALDVEDKRQRGDDFLQASFRGELTSVQRRMARALIAHETGVLVAPPGVGKTVVGAHLVAQRGCSTLVLVHRRPLLEQWRAQLSFFLGIDPKSIGQLGGGKRSANGRLDVAMIQSLVRAGKVADLVAGYGHVIVDECHHVPAVSFERVLGEVRARYIVGLTATPQRRDGQHPITEMQLGPVRFAVDAKNEAARRPFEHRLVVRETSFRAARARTPTIQELYAVLAANEKRNDLILNDVIASLEEGRSPILLTERKDHLEFFTKRLEKFARHFVVLHGTMTARRLNAARDQLAAIPPDQERLVLATGRYIGEGFDDARLDTLFLALPVSWKGTLVQYTGRLHRLHPGKTEVRIYDYVDREVPMLLRMFERRLRGYRAIGYARAEVPLGLGEASEDVTVEYDAESTTVSC
jgi:superfamily II DNA or RNA helicase